MNQLTFMMQFVLFVAFSLQLSAHLYMVDSDIDSGGDSLPFMSERAEIYNLTLLGSDGLLRLRQTKFLIADSLLAIEHASDFSGKAIPHVHFRNDYQSVDLEDANRYWDSKFDCPTMAMRESNATNKINNYARMLGGMVKQPCRYWISEEDFMNCIQALEAGEVTAKDVFRGPG